MRAMLRASMIALAPELRYIVRGEQGVFVKHGIDPQEELLIIAYKVAGDDDFTPVVEAAIRLGTWVEVVYDRTGASEELYSTADRSIILSFDDLWSWGSSGFKSNHPLPNRQYPVHIVISGYHPKKSEDRQELERRNRHTAERANIPGEFFLYVGTPGVLRSSIAIVLICSKSTMPKTTTL